MESDPIKLGAEFKKSRLNAGMTQGDLAEKLGTSRRRIGRLEKGHLTTIGETPEERFAIAAQIAAATGDLSLIDMERPEDRSELLSLRRAVDDLHAEVRLLAETLGSVKGLPVEGRRRLLERFDASPQQLPEEQRGDPGQ